MQHEGQGEPPDSTPDDDHFHAVPQHRLIISSLK
jgi:hypothetical protein